jgi:hypothetical protein
VSFFAEDNPNREPQSNGMAEALVSTIKRDYVRVNPCPYAGTRLSDIVRPASSSQLVEVPDVSGRWGLQQKWTRYRASRTARWANISGTI